MAEGPELILNGGFDVNFNNWSQFVTGAGSFARRFAPDANMEVKPGLIPVPPPTGPQPATAIGHQSFTVTVSTDYKLRFDVDTLDGPTPAARIGGISTSSDVPLTWITQIGISSLGAKESDWTSPGSGTTVFAKQSVQGLNTGLVRTDDWSVKEQGVIADFRPIILFY